MAVYYWGTSGKTVAMIQEKLKECGYYQNDVDGIFGACTYYALTKFQSDRGMEPNGIAENTVLSGLGIKTVTAYEREIYSLAEFIKSRGEGEPYTGQVAIGAVVINRAADSRYPDRVEDIIMTFGGPSVQDESCAPDRIYIRASRDAFNGWDPTGGALWFGKKDEAWLSAAPVRKRIGGLVFG